MADTPLTGQTRIALLEQSLNRIAGDMEDEKRMWGLWREKIDDRMRWHDRGLWMGMGGLAVLQIVLSLWPKG